MGLNKEFIFIIGSPKSGTTWLQTMMGAHPLVCTTVEQTIFSRYTASWIRIWKREADIIERGRWYQGLPFVWQEADFYNFLREFIDKVYDRVLALKPAATHILDKHPGYSMYVEDINRLLPNARFIHVLRDGRDVALSLVAARKKIGYGPRTFVGAAMTWKEHVEAAKKASKYVGRYLEVRYEDLLTAGENTLKTVFDFCGLPLSLVDVSKIIETHQFERMKAERLAPDKRAKLHPSYYRKGKAGSWQEDLSPVQRYIFDKIAGKLLCELGYAKANWCAKSQVQRIIFPLLTPSILILAKIRSIKQKVVRE